MINCIYQLTSPRKINLKYENIDLNNKVIVKPKFMSICHADQRYYHGRRPRSVLKKKLPMALIHECCGIVLSDHTGNFSVGSKVVLVPNIPPTTCIDNIFENYQKGSKFCSSGIDGFMQEVIPISYSRLIEFHSENDYIFSLCEPMSVCVHSCKRFLLNNNKILERIAVFGDGPIGFLMSLILKNFIPNTQIIVIGHHEEKLAQFSFVDKTYIEIPSDLEFDHAFECVGGYGCQNAVDSIISHINPQGTVVLMGVSENKVPVNTRDMLEKGLTFMGSSRSGFDDFKDSVKFLENEEINKIARRLISFGTTINKIDDIYTVFEQVLNVPFKLVFEWNL